VVHVGRAEVWTGGIGIGRDQRLIQRGIAGKGAGEDQAVAGLNVYRSGKQAGIGAARKALRNVDLGVYIFVATHKIDDDVAGDRGQVTVTGAVEGHARIALKSGWNESCKGIGPSHHRIVRPILPVVRRDMEKHLIPVSPEVIGHDDPVAGRRVNRRANFCLWPRIAVLVNLNVVKSARCGGGGSCLRRASRSLGLHQCLRTTMGERGTVAIKRCFVVLLHPLNVGREIFERSRRGLSTRLSAQQESQRGPENRPQEGKRLLIHPYSPYFYLGEESYSGEESRRATRGEMSKRADYW